MARAPAQSSLSSPQQAQSQIGQSLAACLAASAPQ